MFFWYFVKSDFSSVHVHSSLYWFSRFLQGTRNTRLSLTGHLVFFQDRGRVYEDGAGQVGARGEGRPRQTQA